MMKCKKHLLSAVCVAFASFASLVIGSGQDASGGCFAASWNATASGVSNESIEASIIRPLTRFPSSHYLRSNPVCGQTFGEGIPTSGVWPLDTEPSVPQNCTTVSGAELFFGLHRGSTLCPASDCSFTGLHQPGTVVMYFVRDASGETNLVIHVGAPNAESMARGECKLFIEAEVAANRGVVPLQFDGIGARNASDGSWYGTCANASQDCHSWDTAIGKGYFQWSGGKVSADGMVLGPFPTDQAYSLHILPIVMDGLTSLSLLSEDPATGDLTAISVDSSALDWQAGMEFTVLPSCPLPDEPAADPTPPMLSSTAAFVDPLPQVALSTCGDIPSFGCAIREDNGECAGTHDQNTFIGAACPITCTAGCAAFDPPSTPPTFTRLDAASRCNKSNLESRAPNFSLGGGGHTFIECRDACEVQPECTAFAFSAIGFCHMFEECTDLVGTTVAVTFLRAPVPAPTQAPTAAPTAQPSQTTISPTSTPTLMVSSTAPTTATPTFPTSFAPTGLGACAGFVDSDLCSFLVLTPATCFSTPSYATECPVSCKVCPTDAPTSTSPTSVSPTVQPSTEPTTLQPTSHPSTPAPTPSVCSGYSDSPLCSFVLLNDDTCGTESIYVTMCPIGCNACTAAPTARPSHAPTATPTAAPTTSRPSEAPTAVPSASPTTQSPSVSPTENPSTRPTEAPTAAPSAAPTTQSPSVSPTENPSTRPTDAPTAVPSANPTTQSPSESPTENPSTRPTEAPTAAPSATPTTLGPSFGPTGSPSTMPTEAPTRTPSAVPTKDPTSLSPTRQPTTRPSEIPTTTPSRVPTTVPSVEPSPAPSPLPTVQPTTNPVAVPTSVPSLYPTTIPTLLPTAQPTLLPTQSPSVRPTESPTHDPTKAPTASEMPSSAPVTLAPTTKPSDAPSATPTQTPSSVPTVSPTKVPTASPTDTPTFSPTSAPSMNPTATPTPSPSQVPTLVPSSRPTTFPTVTPTSQSPTTPPTSAPSQVPTTSSPTSLPTVQPTAVPTTEPTVSCVCREGHVAPVCHVATQTSYGNMCLAWCAGHFATSPGYCTPVSTETAAPTAQVCPGPALGYFDFTTYYADAVFAAVDTELIVEKANAVLLGTGKSTRVTCAAINVPRKSITIYSEVDRRRRRTAFVDNCMQAGYVLADFAAIGSIDLRMANVVVAVANRYTLHCASPTTAPTALPTNTDDPTTTVTSGIDESDITASTTQGGEGESEVLGTSDWLILIVVSIVGLALILGIIECTRKKRTSDQQLKLLELVKVGVLGTHKKAADQRGRSSLDGYEEDNMFLSPSRASESSGRITSDMAWGSPMSRATASPRNQGGEWASWVTPDEYLATDPASFHPEGREPDLYMAVRTGPLEGPTTAASITSPDWTEEDDKNVYTRVQKETRLGPPIVKVESDYEMASAVSQQDEDDERIYSRASEKQVSTQDECDDDYAYNSMTPANFLDFRTTNKTATADGEITPMQLKELHHQMVPDEGRQQSPLLHMSQAVNYAPARGVGAAALAPVTESDEYEGAFDPELAEYDAITPHLSSVVANPDLNPISAELPESSSLTAETVTPPTDSCEVGDTTPTRITDDSCSLVPTSIDASSVSVDANHHETPLLSPDASCRPAKSTSDTTDITESIEPTEYDAITGHLYNFWASPEPETSAAKNTSQPPESIPHVAEHGTINTESALVDGLAAASDCPIQSPTNFSVEDEPLGTDQHDTPTPHHVAPVANQEDATATVQQPLYSPNEMVPETDHYGSDSDDSESDAISTTFHSLFG